MRTGYCSRRNILHPSTLLDFKYEMGPYYGCEHDCLYCYVQNDTERTPTGEILIHRDFERQLGEELFSLEPQTIYVGMDTDPYQPVEEKFKHTRQALELFAERGFTACILTKSDLVTRDIDLLTSMPGSSVGTSVAFQTEHTRTKFEICSPSIRRRIDALRKVKEAGIETYALICPVMPLITNVGMQMDMLAPFADTIWIYRLKMQSESDPNWRNTRTIIERFFPEILNEFKEISFAETHSYWHELKSRLEGIKKMGALNLVINV